MPDGIAASSEACGLGCRTCPFGEAAEAPGGLTGARFAAAAAITFLLPLGLAVAGALAGGDTALGELLGALGGLVAGGWLATRVEGTRKGSPG